MVHKAIEAAVLNMHAAFVPCCNCCRGSNPVPLVFKASTLRLSHLHGWTHTSYENEEIIRVIVLFFLPRLLHLPLDEGFFFPELLLPVKSSPLLAAAASEENRSAAAVRREEDDGSAIWYEGRANSTKQREKEEAFKDV